MEQHEELKELMKKFDSILSEQGLKVSGNGILAENTKKMIEVLDKIQKFMYFMEKRQEEMFNWMKEHLGK